MESTSTSLLLRLRQPADAAAWKRFVDLYTPLMFYWARRTGLQTADAADLVQDVFALLLRKLPQFDYDRQGSFRGWLRTVTLNAWRQARRRAAPPASGASEHELETIAAPEPSGDFWEDEYRRQVVARAIELLAPEFSPNVWEACRKYLETGRSAAEVAEEFGISVWTVYAAKSRLLRRLRQELDGLLD